MRQFCALAISTLAVVGMSGCALAPGGNGVSEDKFVYVSSNQSPKTVSIMDTRNRQVVWTSEVPVGEQLVIKFFEGEDPKAYFPDTMKYGFTKAGGYSVAYTSEISVPGAESRRVDWSIRPMPEFPAGEKAAVAPAPAAVTSSKKAATKKPDMVDLPETEAPKTNPEPVREVK